MKKDIKSGECPIKLAKLIELANLTPANALLPYSEGLEEIYRKRRATRGDKFFAPIDRSYTGEYLTDYEIWTRFLGNRDELIRDIIVPYPKLIQYLDDLDNYTEANKKDEFGYAFTYLWFVQISMRLREIALENLRYLTNAEIIDPSLIYMFADVEYENRAVSVKYFVEDGEGKFRLDEVQEALKGANPIRLRVCPICKNIFWARKTNSATCGNQKCIDTLQNQKKKAKKQEAQNGNL